MPSMATTDVRAWLLALPVFQKQVDGVIRAALWHEFPRLVRSGAAPEPLDWNYLLLCASLLARSDRSAEQRIALRVADMKSRDLNTTHDLIVSNYRISPTQGGKFRHTFTPKNTSTVYEFEANSAPLVKNGERYNIGYHVDSSGRNIVDVSALSKTSIVNPMFSFSVAQQLARQNRGAEKAKNDQRVSHSGKGGYYWGKKYAWRMFGTVIGKEAFYSYLEEIMHPSVPCITTNPDLPFSSRDSSTAFKEVGLEDAMRKLISSAVKVSGAYYKSPLYSKKFSVRGLNAITDKK